MSLVSAPKTETIIDEVVVGFEVGQFAIVDGGEVSKNLERRVISPIQKLLQKKVGEEQIRISVIGYTDTTGSRNLNQDLGDRRALQAKAFISEKLAVIPPNNITTRTVGDAGNNRAIRVICTLVAEAEAEAPPQMPQMSQMSVRNKWGVVFLWVLVVGLGVYFFSRLIVRNDPPKKINGNRKDILNFPFVSKGEKQFIQVSDAEKDLRYLVEVRKDTNGVWLSPIPLMDVSKSTVWKTVHGNSPKEIVRNLKRCFVGEKRSTYYRPIFFKMADRDRKETIFFEGGGR